MSDSRGKRRKSASSGEEAASPQGHGVGGASPGRRGWRPWMAAGVTTLAVALILVAINALGRMAQTEIRFRPRYEFPIMHIDCPTPPAMTREAFLGEVRARAGLPPTLSRLDPQTPQRLREAFEAHPWVERVHQVVISPEGQIRVEIHFRHPVLAVRTLVGEERLLDAAGVVLPRSPKPPQVTELANPLAGEVPADGQPWPDANVRRALDLTLAYQPRRLEKTPQGWELRMPDGKTLRVEQ